MKVSGISKHGSLIKYCNQLLANKGLSKKSYSVSTNYLLQLPLAQGERWVPGVYPTCVREVGGVFSMMKTFALFVESFQYDENFSYFWGEF